MVCIRPPLRGLHWWRWCWLLVCGFGLLGFDLLRLDGGKDESGGLLNDFQALGRQSSVAVV